MRARYSRNKAPGINASGLPPHAPVICVLLQHAIVVRPRDNMNNGNDEHNTIRKLMPAQHDADNYLNKYQEMPSRNFSRHTC